MVTGRRGRFGSLSVLSRARGRHGGCGLNGLGSCSGPGGLIIVQIAEGTIFHGVVELGTVEIRVEGLDLVNCNAPAVGKGLTSVARVGSYAEAAVDTTTGKGISDGACSKQLREERKGKSGFTVHSDNV